jgi:N-acetylglucosaminyldiphosphoundecaprenol N-acetyl-beta-D-mannosaminyltransferase
MSAPSRCDVLGVAITEADLGRALEAVLSASAAGQGGYVCFTNVHAVVTAKDDAEFRRATNMSLMSLADGKPVYWFARSLRRADIGHVPGPDFMLEALSRFPDRRHFFYGSTPATLGRLVQALTAAIPGLTVCGCLSPPFGTWSDAQKRADYVKISDARPDFVWVGLGAPKQEKWMSEACAALAPAVLFGVGAAFDFHAGTAARAPEWMRRLGLEWLFRLASEPRRLWKRYLVTNTRFAWYVAGSILGRRM